MALFNRKQKIKKNCELCKTEFLVLPSRNHKRFCSRSCGIKTKHTQGILKSPAGWNKGKGAGIVTTNGGYRMITVGKHKMMLEHRLVMEKHLGRKLKTFEHIHHIDGNKLNNKISNLEITNVIDHAKEHYAQGNGLSKYNKSRML